MPKSCNDEPYSAAMDALINRRVTLKVRVNVATKRSGVHIPQIEENTITTIHLTYIIQLLSSVEPNFL